MWPENLQPPEEQANVGEKRQLRDINPNTGSHFFQHVSRHVCRASHMSAAIFRPSTNTESKQTEAGLGGHLGAFCSPTRD